MSDFKKKIQTLCSLIVENKKRKEKVSKSNKPVNLVLDITIKEYKERLVEILEENERNY